MKKQFSIKIIKLIAVLFIVIVPVSILFYGCGDDSSAPPVRKAVKPIVKGSAIAPAVQPADRAPEIKEESEHNILFVLS